MILRRKQLRQTPCWNSCRLQLLYSGDIIDYGNYVLIPFIFLYFTFHKLFKMSVKVYQINKATVNVVSVDNNSKLEKGSYGNLEKLNMLITTNRFHVKQFSSEYRHDFFRPNEVWLLNERGTYE